MDKYDEPAYCSSRFAVSCVTLLSSAWPFFVLVLILFANNVQAGSHVIDDAQYKYQSNEECGLCHQEYLEDYERSMMGRTPFDKVFQQFYFARNAHDKPDGIGYKAVEADKPGDCANCHTPDVVLNEGKEVDLQTAIEKGSKGISCDFCHTVADVQVLYDRKTGRYDTDINRLLSRARGKVKRGGLRYSLSPVHKTVYSPIHTRSEFCAMCHLNQEHLLSLTTYDDWKRAYDKGLIKKQCQDCHMPVLGGDRPIAIGGPVRSAAKIHRHFFHGGRNAEQVKRAAKLRLVAQRRDGQLVVKARVTNSGSGHKFPGGATLRNVILLVEATDAHGKPLSFQGDPQELLPSLAGEGKGVTDYAGRPGLMFARPFVSRDGKLPVGGFNADHVLFDTRIGPRDSVEHIFHFSGLRGEARVRARLIYRWVYKPLADIKGWKLQDIVIAERQLRLKARVRHE